MTRRQAPPSYLTTRDLVIPAGTILFPPPTSSSRWRSDYEAPVAVDRDTTAFISMDVAEGIESGLLSEAFPLARDDKVVPIGGDRVVGEGFRVEPDQVLNQALGLNDEVVLVGIGKDGALTVASSGGAEEAMILLDLAKRWMLAETAKARGIA